MLSRELRHVTSRRTDGYFDGPRAWMIATYRLAGEERTKMDKEAYRVAENRQRSKPLLDGCSASDYSKRALAFLVLIKPNLPYDSSTQDAADFFLDLLKRLRKQLG